MTNGATCLICGTSHEASVESNRLGYLAIYRAQMDYGDKLPWQEERKVFHQAVHDYYIQHPGKIS